MSLGGIHGPAVPGPEVFPNGYNPDVFDPGPRPADWDAGLELPASAEAHRIDEPRQRLLAWYGRHRRALPWRDVGDPYRVLVSEVMLQQTQVERVVPRYHAFLDRFPTLVALAEAPRSDVIRAWAPLGYNRRAVRLHELALLVASRGGALPSEPAALRKLAGLGEYTAAAIACFAFGQQVPTIDTNVRRVLGRLFADRFGPHGPSAGQLRALAVEVLPAGRARDWNQALMDLGATLCTAARPACGRCPLAGVCAARPRIGQLAAPATRRAAGARAGYRAAGSFVNSSRYFRGRIVDRLRALRPGTLMPLEALGPAVRPDYSEALRPWLEDLARGLASDGLARLEPSGADGTGLWIGLP